MKFTISFLLLLIVVISEAQSDDYWANTDIIDDSYWFNMNAKFKKMTKEMTDIMYKTECDQFKNLLQLEDDILSLYEMLTYKRKNICKLDKPGRRNLEIPTLPQGFVCTDASQTCSGKGMKSSGPGNCECSEGYVGIPKWAYEKNIWLNHCKDAQDTCDGEYIEAGPGTCVCTFGTYGYPYWSTEKGEWLNENCEDSAPASCKGVGMKSPGPRQCECDVGYKGIPKWGDDYESNLWDFKNEQNGCEDVQNTCNGANTVSGPGICRCARGYIGTPKWNSDGQVWENVDSCTARKCTVCEDNDVELSQLAVAYGYTDITTCESAKKFCSEYQEIQDICPVTCDICDSTLFPTGNGRSTNCDQMVSGKDNICIQSCLDGYTDVSNGGLADMGQEYTCPDGKLDGTILECRKLTVTSTNYNEIDGALVGDKVTLKCSEANNHPSDTTSWGAWGSGVWDNFGEYTWYFDGSVINGAISQSYTINKVDLSKSGTYKCEAKFSSVMVQSSTIDVFIHGGEKNYIIIKDTDLMKTDCVDYGHLPITDFTECQNVKSNDPIQFGSYTVNTSELGCYSNNPNYCFINTSSNKIYFVDSSSCQQSSSSSSRDSFEPLICIKNDSDTRRRSLEDSILTKPELDDKLDNVRRKH